jgi:hypothetical protein
MEREWEAQNAVIAPNWAGNDPFYCLIATLMSSGDMSPISMTGISFISLIPTPPSSF